MTDMDAFQRGEEVEVASNAEGFFGSYWAARIVSPVTAFRTTTTGPSIVRRYLVEYKTLVTDDYSGPLKEVVPEEDIRPVPPQLNVPPTSYRASDLVDVYDNEGWWVGEVTTVGAGYCFVHFPAFKQVIGYSFDQVRVHHEWVDGKWIPSISMA